MVDRVVDPRPWHERVAEYQDRFDLFGVDTHQWHATHTYDGVKTSSGGRFYHEWERCRVCGCIDMYEQPMLAWHQIGLVNRPDGKVE